MSAINDLRKIIARKDGLEFYYSDINPEDKLSRYNALHELLSYGEVVISRREKKLVRGKSVGIGKDCYFKSTSLLKGVVVKEGTDLPGWRSVFPHYFTNSINL